MFVTLFASATSALADNIVSVGTALIPQGKTGSFAIELSNTDVFASSMEIHLTLPDGITFNGVTLSDRITDNPSVGKTINGQSVTITTLSTTNAPIAGSSGPLLFVSVSADATLEVGTTLTASVTKMEMAKKVGNGHEKYNPDPVNFGIEITDRMVLDETSPIAPAQLEGVNILVKRTIKAGQWSTLVLPFDMDDAQLTEAFGNDVQLAEYIDHEMNDEATLITVNFEDVDIASDGLIANYPYIIKTSKDITQFTVDDVDIDPDEENAFAEYSEGRGSKKKIYGTFRGTYHAGTVVPSNMLFISDNKFWYSKGLTKMKAFRGYFDFVDVLASVEDASSRISLHFGGSDATGVCLLSSPDSSSSTLYDLQGRRVSKSVKAGLYIRNGRKEVVR